MFGGPLRIPKLVSAGKRIMFTFDYQAQRNRTGVISDPVNMPTALERIGDFSQSTVQGSKAVPVGFSVPLDKLQPGRYTCQVNVLNPSEHKFAVWRSPSVLLP